MCPTITKRWPRWRAETASRSWPRRWRRDGSVSLSANLIGDADTVAIDHLPALPAGEQQDQHHDERQDDARRHNRLGSVRIARVPVVELDQDRNDVASRV